jgi:DNA-binding XRE family transcriptional regulator
MELIEVPFIKSDPEKTKKELALLAQTEDGARAIRNFDLELEFRRKLIEARKQTQLSQSEISKRSGLKQQAISRLEQGYQDRSVTLPTLLRYVDALGLSLSLQQKAGDNATGQ